MNILARQCVIQHYLSTPGPIRLRRDLNPRARRVMRQCLEFRPEQRFGDVGDILPVLTGSRRRLRWVVVATAVLCAATIGLAVRAAEAGPEVKDTVRITPESGLSSSAAISADAKWIAYSSDRGQRGNMDIWIQSTSEAAPRRLTTHPAMENETAIAPDGKLVAFHSERHGGGLYLVNAEGSGERLLAAGGWSPAFSPDGRLPQRLHRWRPDIFYEENSRRASTPVPRSIRSS